MTRPVSIVIPACGGTDDFHQHLPALMAEIGDRCAGDELIVVDDTRDTQVRDWFSANYAPVRVVRHGEARGYGQALLTGGAAAENELVLFLASGVAVKPGSVTSLVDALEPDVLAACPVFDSDARHPDDGEKDGDNQRVWSTFFFRLLGARPGPDFVDDRALLMRCKDLPEESTADLLSPYCVDPSEIGQQMRKLDSRVVQVAEATMDYTPVDLPVERWEALRDLALGRNVLLAHWLHLADEKACREHVQNLRDHVEGFARIGRSEQLVLLVLALDRVGELRAARAELQEQATDDAGDEEASDADAARASA